MAEAWTVLTVEMIRPYLVAAQLDALNSSALGSGQNPRFNDAMPAVAARVRKKILSCKGNVVSATANSVPPELVMATALLIVDAIQPGLQIALTEDQVRQIATANADLNRVADCKDTVTEPTDPLTPGPAQTGGYIKVVHSVCAAATRAKMAGI